MKSATFTTVVSLVSETEFRYDAADTEPTQACAAIFLQSIFRHLERRRLDDQLDKLLLLYVREQKKDQLKRRSPPQAGRDE